MVSSSDRLLTSHDVGRLLQMDPSSVVKWVKDGLLPAFLTPGGHRRIPERALVAFLRKHNMYIPPELAAGRQRVLIVEDDVKVARALQRALKAHADAVEVELAEGGIAALLRLGAQPPDVFVLDAAMPGLDGLEVVERLKANPATREVEVILTSGRATAELRKRAEALGARAVLQKPLSAEALLELLVPGASRAARG